MSSIKDGRSKNPRYLGMYGFIDPNMVLMIPMIKHQLEHGRSESLEQVSTGLDEESELPNIYEVTGCFCLGSVHVARTPGNQSTSEQWRVSPSKKVGEKIWSASVGRKAVDVSV